jgi:hypothetical protein
MISMVKKMDFRKFSKNLMKYQKKENDQSDRGLANVIRYVWNQYPTKYVDFDSFSYDDVIRAMDTLSEIPIDDYDESDEINENDVKENPWYHNMIVENTVAHLFHTKNKVYENDDDFI